MMENHFFRLVWPSPWPITLSFSLLNLGAGVIYWIKSYDILPLFFFFILSFLIVGQWWRDVIREAVFEGKRSTKINLMINSGVILFIVSEICFFGSFFWAYFYFSLSPDYSLGVSWPPKGIVVVDYLGIPFLNTLILLASGVFITWAHYSVINNSFYMAKTSLFFCAMLGLYFLMVQGYEYVNMSFSFTESVFGSSFFTLTGFHGFHVLVGLIFIFINLIRLMRNYFSPTGLLGLEYSIWYWHFVDLVWPFLYCFIYWWGC
uniref:Cytochrome c oxidase subunit 3 n=1 Tax=Tetraleurodes acaciae TaxID=267835 RepID=Q674P0_TETAA|nr:cytochrome c oxidase subunit III [Tetraleurodes acaciae]AAU14159.1 cytochrome oxidase subunit III [Tetraleurodes acaciae]